MPRVLTLMSRCPPSEIHVPLADLLVFTAATNSLFTALFTQLCVDVWRALCVASPLGGLPTCSAVGVKCYFVHPPNPHWN